MPNKNDIVWSSEVIQNLNALIITITNMIRVFEPFKTDIPNEFNNK